MVHLPSLFHGSSHHSKSRHSTSSGRNSRESSILSSNDTLIEEGKNWIMKQLHMHNSTDRRISPHPTHDEAPSPLMLTPYSSHNRLSTLSNKSVSDTSSVSHMKLSTGSLRDYGECYKRLGKGSTAIISICRRKKNALNAKNYDDCKLYAIKQFRKRNRNETDKALMKKLISEFCISSTFHHPNIVETIDLVIDDQSRYCTVMEYCPGGDLFSAIMSSHMSPIEMGCCFKQLMNGIAYLHSVGVAHRDIKPENLLLTLTGELKITDFGVSDVFRCAWETQRHKSHGMVGSEPYIAPEVFQSKDDYWGSNADIWSAGIVLYSIFCGGHAWVRADPKKDRDYWNYEQHYHSRSYQNFLRFPLLMRQLIYRMLDPNPDTRISADEILTSEWVQSLKICDHNVDELGRTHHHVIHVK